MDRIATLNFIKAASNGSFKNNPLRLLCKEALPMMDETDRNKLLSLLKSPFATTLELYETASGGVLSKIVDIINFDRRPRWKDEIINGVDTCSAIYYNDEEEEPWDEKKIEKEIEMLDKINKFKP